MRKMSIGLVLAAVSTAAAAQSTGWQFYQPDGGTVQAFVVTNSGEQLIFKCEKPGKHSVFAVIVNNTSIAAPVADDRYESRPVTLRVDDGAPWDDNWRFNGKFAMAVDKGNTRSLTRLVEKLIGGDMFEARLKPLRQAPVVVDFGVTGAQDALAQVFDSCNDTMPVPEAAAAG